MEEEKENCQKNISDGRKKKSGLECIWKTMHIHLFVN